jgi:alkanesulfonate monooxygenase SsuD/methylene tetrahydromethanopterin reductase-like flavin-dependent oxidoreductase (luciferase family)
LATGSISVGLYRRPDEAPIVALRSVCAEAKLAEEAGLDGVTLSEHHMGFREYFPNPLLISGFVLSETSSIWAGPMPMLLTLRPPAIVSEDVAWLAARYSGRVVAGFAAGNRPEEHALYEERGPDVFAAFDRGLRVVAESLGGYGDATASVLRGDPAVDSFRGRIPMVSAGRSRAAARRAAKYGMGILHSPLSSPQEMRRQAEEYVSTGGRGRRVLIYSVCISASGQLTDELGAKGSWTLAGTVEQVVDGLVSVIQQSGADALNLRFARTGSDPGGTREQIALLGASGALPAIRQALLSTRVPAEYVGSNDS